MADPHWALTDFDAPLYRSIPTIRPSEDLWDDLTDEAEAGAVMDAAIARGKPAVGPPNLIHAPFAYFEQAHRLGNPPPDMLATRYSDGNHAVWYGGLRPAVALAETLYWFVRGALEDELAAHSGPVVGHRAVGSAQCRALLIDLQGQEQDLPQLIDPNDYGYCRRLGGRIHNEGHPGLLAPSARSQGGIGAIFNDRVLSDGRVLSYARFQLEPATGQVSVTSGEGDPVGFDLEDLLAGVRVSAATMGLMEAGG